MTPEERKRLKDKREEAIKNKGFYSKKGLWNSIITFPGDDRLYRHRVETIIVRNGKEVFVKKKPNGEYRLPGGSVEKDIPNINQALNECREEAHIDVSNIESTGITYKIIRKSPQWAYDECELQWDGYYNEVYIGEFNGKYKGHIDDEDQDPFIRSGRWYSTKECFRFFRKEHKDALLWWLKQQNEKENEEVTTESYITNYFGNRKLLKKISNSPDIEKSAIDKMIAELKKAYSTLSSKSSIKREQKREDVGELFHPVLTFDFSDGQTISIGICFDKSSITDGAAVHTENYGDMVIVYPCFFDSDTNNQIFTILHEIGHIRLGHLKLSNSKRNIFGKDISEEHRSKVMSKGKVVYPEVNADYYAILNGASMYAILGSSIKKDMDEEYDYRFTNNELANRYQQVWSKLQKSKSPRLCFEEGHLSYDASCMAIYEMVYQNNLDLSNDDKKKLYGLVYEYFINKKIKNSKEYRESFSKEDKALLFNKIRPVISESSDNVIRFSKEKNLIKDEIITEMTELQNQMKINIIATENSSDSILNSYVVLLESLTQKERNNIEVDKFGIPELRKYPLDSRKHTESAIRLFGHCDSQYEKELADNIFKAMKKYNISKDIIGPKSKLNKYM